MQIFNLKNSLLVFMLALAGIAQAAKNCCSFGFRNDMKVPVKVRLMSNVPGSKAFSSFKTIKAGKEGGLVFHFRTDKPEDADKAVVSVEVWWKENGKDQHGGISGNWKGNTNWAIEEDGSVVEL